MKRTFRLMRAPVLAAALVAATVALSASAADLKNGLKIAFVPKQINNPYEVAADDGGMAAIKEMKGDGKVVGPSDAGASSQVSYINTLITQRQNAIVIASNPMRSCRISRRRCRRTGHDLRLGHGAGRAADFRQSGRVGSDQARADSVTVEADRR